MGLGIRGIGIEFLDRNQIRIVDHDSMFCHETPGSFRIGIGGNANLLTLVGMVIPGRIVQGADGTVIEHTANQARLYDGH